MRRLITALVLFGLIFWPSASVQAAPRWGYCADGYPGRDMVFLVRGAGAVDICAVFTTHTITGFGRLKAINRARLTWQPMNDTFSYHYGPGKWDVTTLHDVCVYDYRYDGGTGQLGVYDDYFQDYGRSLCSMLATGTLETGQPAWVDWSCCAESATATVVPTRSASSSSGGHITGIEPFVGAWIAHGRGLDISLDGTAFFEARTYTWCGSGVTSLCDTMKGNMIIGGISVTAQIVSVSGPTARATVTGSTVPGTVSKSLSFRLLPHRRLDFTGPTKWLNGVHLCNQVFFNDTKNYVWWDCGA